MSVEAAIHSRYAANLAVTQLCPAAKFITGVHQHENQASPYGSLTRVGALASLWTTSGKVTRHQMRFQFWPSSYGQGDQIKTAVKNLYDNQSFTEGDTHVSCMRLSNEFELQEDDGSWQFVMDFDVDSQAAMDT